MAHYKIQSNVPIPPSRERIKRGKMSKLRIMMTNMKVGQCLFHPTASKEDATRHQVKFASYAFQIRKANKSYAYTTRVMADGARVWRVK